MNREKKVMNVKISGYEDQLWQLAIFLRKIEYLGNVGSSRTLHLWVDGDGAARIKCEFPELGDVEVDTKALSEGGEREKKFLTMAID